LKIGIRRGRQGKKRTILGALFLFFALNAAGWAGEVTVFRTNRTPVNGIVIAAHGLNVKPSKMGSPTDEGTIVKALLDGGYHVVRAGFAGHSGEAGAMADVTAQAWLDDARDCVSAARAEAARAEALTRSRCPLYLAGFSLGALVFEVLMNEDAVFDKAVLFSPAFAIKRLAHGVLLLDTAEDSRIIASRSPAEYRAGAGASIAAYKALFALEERLESFSFAKNNIPTLVFIEPLDELVSYGKLKRLVTKYDLTNWRLQKVSNKGGRVRPAYHHLIIDAVCLGEEGWAAVRRDMLGFLAGQR
jgi:alpha-beta hydrolase superfamily lysophospholipase